MANQYLRERYFRKILWDGGIIAILTGTPEITANNFEFT